MKKRVTIHVTAILRHTNFKWKLIKYEIISLIKYKYENKNIQIMHIVWASDFFNSKLTTFDMRSKKLFTENRNILPFSHAFIWFTNTFPYNLIKFSNKYHFLLTTLAMFSKWNSHWSLIWGIKLGNKRSLQKT